MKKAWRLLATVLALMMVVTFLGCGGTTEQPPEGTQGTAGETTEPAAEPMQIVMARPADSRSLDPVLQDGNVNIWVFNLIMEGLVKCDNEGTRSDVPTLATEWEFSDDLKSITFTLRDGVKFSNGDPLTAEDVKWSLDRARLADDSTWQFALEAIDNIEVLDDTHVRIDLKEVWAPILADLAMFSATITSKAYFEEVGQEAFAEKPLGTGPFYLEEWVRGEYILLKKNPYYWQEGLPLADEVKITVVPDDNTRIMQLQGGEIDMIEAVPFARHEELADDPNIEMVYVPSTSTRYLQFNNAQEPFNDKRVREALAYGTDVDTVIDMILFGVGERASSFMPKAGPMWNPNIKLRPYDVEKAKAMLADAGYADGFTTEIVIDPGSVDYNQLATILKDQWAKLNINLEIKQLESGTRTDYVRNGEYYITVGGWTNDIVDPSQLVEYVALPDASHNAWTWWSTIADPAVVAHLESLAQEGKVTIDVDKRQAIYYEIQEIVDSEMPRIPLYHTPYMFAYGKDVSGFVQTPLGNYRFEKLTKTQ